MSEQHVVVDRLYAAFNARRFDVYRELLDEDALLVMNGQSLRGAAALRDWIISAVGELPGVRVQLERVLADNGDTIVDQTRYFDVSSTPGSEHAVWGAWRLPLILCEVYRIVGGRIVECRNYLGAEPPGRLPSNAVAPWPGVARLVAEQATLRRVATSVARGARLSEVFEAIVSEAAQLLGEEIWLVRYGVENARTIVAVHGAQDVGQLTGTMVSGSETLLRDLRSGQPVRIDKSYAGLAGADADLVGRLGVSSMVIAPLLVQGTLWGTLLAVSRDAPLTAGTEDRLAQFADLAATVIANAQSRAELQSMADEQTALRRVAELVARGAATQEIFDQVTTEASRVLDDTPMALYRYERSSAEAVIVAKSTADLPMGGRIPLEGANLPAQVWRTGRAVRIEDDYQAIAVVAPRWMMGALAVPIVVEGRLWGVLGGGSTSSLPAGSEERLARFGELVTVAIANAESRTALTASRARIVAAGDEARRRLARDVHDGAQQRLVHALITLKQARAALNDRDTETGQLLDESLVQAQNANKQLRELAHGILPAALARGGLRAGVDSLVSHITLRVDTEVLADRLPEPVETAAYFVIAEALTNAVKHAGAGRAHVRALAADGHLELEVADCGDGGADPSGGSGLIGLADRVEAAGGSMTLDSPLGQGTTLSVVLPIPPSSRPDNDDA